MRARHLLRSGSTYGLRPWGYLSHSRKTIEIPNEALKRERNTCSTLLSVRPSQEKQQVGLPAASFTDSRLQGCGGEWLQVVEVFFFCGSVTASAGFVLRASMHAETHILQRHVTPGNGSARSLDPKKTSLDPAKTTSESHSASSERGLCGSC